MTLPAFETNTCPRWLGAPVPEPTIGDKLRGCESLIEQLKCFEREAVQDLALAETRLQAIRDHLTEAETRHNHLTELEQDERYGEP